MGNAQEENRSESTSKYLGKLFIDYSVMQLQKYARSF